MQLKKLKLTNHYILKNLEIDFSKPISVIIGENGSGKSTLLRVIAEIFSDAFLGDNKYGYYRYSLYYTIDLGSNRKADVVLSSNNIRVEFDNIVLDSREEIKRNNQLKQIGYVNTDNIRKILPSSIVIYYSGFNKYMKELCEPHLKNQIDAFKKGDSSFQREIIYCDDFDFKILIALYFSNLERSEMEQDVKCQNWIWSLGLTEKKPSKGLKFFIDLLSDKFPLNENGESGTIGSLKLDEIDNKTFFENLNMAYNEGVLKSIKTFVIGADNHEQSSESFSEGEQQMLIIKALNKIFDGENCLFLFDEPDTFLHPKWQGEFIQHLEENNRNSQYIITSHSPFIAAALKKEQLYVMKKEEDKIIVNHPMNHPYGKTVDEILIDAFGLSSLRSVEAQSEINQIWDLIKSEKTDNEEFKRKLEELEKSIGKDNRAITSIKIELLKRQKLKNA